MTNFKRYFKYLFLFVAFLLIYLYRDNILVFLAHTWYGWVGTRVPQAGSSVRGKLETITFYSELLKTNRTMKVYLPYNYDQIAFGHFPVLYLLHGFAGNPDDWTINAKIVDVVEGLISSGKMPPVIMVMPDGNGPKEMDSEYLDATKIDQPMESHLVKEVVPYIDSKYRTFTVPQGRALAGVSTGGYGAVNLAFHHPDIFATAVSLGGYFINREWVTNRLLDSDQSARQKNDPLSYIDNFNSDTKMHVYLSVAQNDYKDFIADNEAFAAKLDQKQIDHVLVKVEGAHFWGPWNRSLPDALTWLGEIFKTGL